MKSEEACWFGSTKLCRTSFCKIRKLNEYRLLQKSCELLMFSRRRSNWRRMKYIWRKIVNETIEPRTNLKKPNYLSTYFGKWPKIPARRWQNCFSKSENAQSHIKRWKWVLFYFCEIRIKRNCLPFRVYHTVVPLEAKSYEKCKRSAK